MSPRTLNQHTEDDAVAPRRSVGPVGPRVVSPAPRELWREVFAADPYALPTQTAAWTDVVCRCVGGVDASRLYEFPDGRRLVLPLIARRVAGLRVAEESMPYGLGCGGVLSPGTGAGERERQAVLADLARRQGLRTALTPSPLVAAEWSADAHPSAVRVPFLSHMLDLSDGWPAVTRRFRADIRASVRKAGKQPLDIRMVRDDSLVDVFAGLNARSVARWAQQRGQSQRVARLVERQRNRVGRLRLALATPGAGCIGWAAHLGGVPVAAHIALFSEQSAISWLSAMDKPLADRTRAGALLTSLAVEHACATGARWFHFGESDAGSGVAMFKEGFGAVPVPYEALRFERLPLTAADARLHRLGGQLAAGRSRRIRPVTGGERW